MFPTCGIISTPQANRLAALLLSGLTPSDGTPPRHTNMIESWHVPLRKDAGRKGMAP